MHCILTTDYIDQPQIKLKIEQFTKTSKIRGNLLKRFAFSVHYLCWKGD